MTKKEHIRWLLLIGLLIAIKKEHIRWLLLIGLLIAILCCLPWYYAWGGTYYHVVTTDSVNYTSPFDTVIYTITPDHGDATTRDSLLLDSASGDFATYSRRDSFNLHTDTSYVLKLRVSYRGDDGISAPASEIIYARGVQIADSINVRLAQLALLSASTSPLVISATNDPGVYISGTYGARVIGSSSDAVHLYAQGADAHALHLQATDGQGIRATSNSGDQPAGYFSNINGVSDTSVFVIDNKSNGAFPSAHGLLVSSGSDGIGAQITGHLYGLNVESDGGNAGRFVSTSGSGIAATGTTAGVRATSSSSGGSGIWAEHSSTSNSGVGFRASAAASGSDAVRFQNPAGQAFYITSDSNASTVKMVNTGTGITLDIRTDSSGDVIQIVAGGPASSTNYAVEVEGGMYFHARDNHTAEDAIRVFADDTGHAVRLWVDSGVAAWISNSKAGDTAVKYGGNVVYTDNIYLDTIDGRLIYVDTVTSAPTTSISAADIEAISADVADTLSDIGGAGPWTAGGGSGANAVTLYAIDSSGTPVAVNQVGFTVRSMGGSPVGERQFTNSSGYTTWNLDDGDYQVIAQKFGYYYPVDTVTVSGAGTDSIIGFNNILSVSAPSDTSQCRVYGQVYDDNNNPISRAVVRFIPPAKAINYCDSVTTVFAMERVTQTDDTGFFQIDLIKSTCLDSDNEGTLRYKAILEKKGWTGSVPYKKEVDFKPTDSVYRLIFR